jgi:hypothetical protein
MSDTNIITRSTRKKYVKKISINNQKMKTLIDIESDICLIRAKQYIKVDAPKLEEKTIRFRSVGSGDNVTLDTVQITINTREVVINASKPVLEDKEVREMCQLGLNSDKANNIEVTYVLNIKHQEQPRIWSTNVKRASYELEVLGGSYGRGTAGRY